MKKSIQLLLFFSLYLFAAKLQAVAPPVADSCDRLHLKSGDIQEVKIVAVEQDRLRYRHCDDPEGVVIVLSRAYVASMEFSGEIPPTTVASSSTSKRFEPLGLTALFMVLLLYLTAPVGLILSIISLQKIKKSPEKYKGSGISLAALFVSIAYLFLIAFYMMILFL